MLPGIKVKEAGMISTEEFGTVYKKLLSDDVGRRFSKNVSKGLGAFWSWQKCCFSCCTRRFIRWYALIKMTID